MNLDLFGGGGGGTPEPPTDADAPLAERMRPRTLDEVAVVPLQNHVPFGFHCGYSPRSFIR